MSKESKPRYGGQAVPSNDIEPEVMEATRLPPSRELIQSGLQAIRIEQDSQVDQAFAHPRDMKKIAQQALDLLDIDPEFALDAFYAIPYDDRESGGVAWVRGLSVKGLTELAKLYGNQSNGARILGDRDDRVICQGVFMDYETGNRWLREWSVPKMVWSRSAKAVVPVRADRLNVMVQAGLSKAVRNAMDAGLPLVLKRVFYAKAVKVALQMLPGNTEDEKYRAKGKVKTYGVSQKGAKAPTKDAAPATKPAEAKEPSKADLLAKVKVMYDAFKKHGIQKATLDKFIQRLDFNKDPAKVLEHMHGIWSAIKDGQTTFAHVFAEPEQKGAKADDQPEGEPGLSTNDLFDDKKTKVH